jgi:hypothetical protein
MRIDCWPQKKQRYNQDVAQKTEDLPNITVPREAFENVLGKLLKAKPLPKAAIPPKRVRPKSSTHPK